MKYIIDFKDETYSVEQFQTYSVDIQVDVGSLIFAVFDTERQKFVHLRQIVLPKNTQLSKNDIENFIDDNTVITKVEKQKTLWYSSKSVIIPNAFYLQDKEFDLLNFNTEISQEYIVKSNKLKTNDYNIFAINKHLFSAFENKLPDAKIYNQGTVLIHNALFSGNNDKQKLQIDATNEFVDIVLAKRNKLLYRNTFRYKSASDFVFFVLNIFDKLKLNIDKTDVFISGSIDALSPETVLLKNYIKKIKYKFPDFNYSYTFNDIKISKFTQLLNLENCE